MKLGIHFGHDSNICIVDDSDNILAYELTERANRLRHSIASIDGTLIESICSKAGISIFDIKLVAISSSQSIEFFLPDDGSINIQFKENGLNKEIDERFTERSRQVQWTYGLKAMRGYDEISKFFIGAAPWFFLKEANGKAYTNSSSSKCHPYPNWYPDLIGNNLSIEAAKMEVTRHYSPIFFELTTCNNKIPGFFVDHHLAHSSSVYHKSGFEEAVIFSADGGGPGASGNLISIGMNKKIVAPAKSTTFAGGQLYWTASHQIGLDPGKMMGLASYGTANSAFISNARQLLIEGAHISSGATEEIIRIYEDITGINTQRLKGERLYDSDDKNWINGFGWISEGHVNFAASIQMLYEIWTSLIIGEIIASIMRPNYIFNLCLTGGCALNCPSNQLISQIDGIKLFIESSCNDEGLSYGAVTALGQIIKDQKPSQTVTPNLPKASAASPFQCSHPVNEEEMIMYAREKGYECIPFNNNWMLVASFVEQGYIGAICRGKGELGPRALGNRSLIAIADQKVNQYILNKIKSRELWRPLAPACLEKDFNHYFQGTPNEYMLMTNHVKEQHGLAAVCHVDGTARAQLVTPNSANFYLLLSALSYYRDHPVIINTSLNGPGEPIIDDCRFALNILENDISSTGRFLLTENYIVRL